MKYSAAFILCSCFHMQMSFADSWEETHWRGAENDARLMQRLGSLMSFISDYPQSKHLEAARSLLAKNQPERPALLKPGQPQCKAKIASYVARHIEKKNKAQRKKQQQGNATPQHYTFQTNGDSFVKGSTIHILPDGANENTPIEHHIYIDLEARKEDDCTLMYRFSDYGQGLPGCECELAYTVSEQEKLYKLLNWGDASERDQTVSSLANSDDPKVVELMFKVLEEGQGANAARAVFNVLKAKQSPALIQPLLNTLKLGYVNHKMKAVGMLADIGDNAVVPHLIEVSEDEYLHRNFFGLKKVILVALGELKDPRALPHLDSVSKNHRKDEIKSVAKLAIEKIKQATN